MASKTTTVAIFGFIAFVSSVVLSCVLWGACRATAANYYINNKGQVLGVLFFIAQRTRQQKIIKVALNSFLHNLINVYCLLLIISFAR